LVKGRGTVRTIFYSERVGSKDAVKKDGRAVTGIFFCKKRNKKNVINVRKNKEEKPRKRAPCSQRSGERRIQEEKMQTKRKVKKMGVLRSVEKTRKEIKHCIRSRTRPNEKKKRESQHFLIQGQRAITRCLKKRDLVWERRNPPDIGLFLFNQSRKHGGD